jgi:hypothetical protein
LIRSRPQAALSLCRSPLPNLWASLLALDPGLGIQHCIDSTASRTVLETRPPRKLIPATRSFRQSMLWSRVRRPIASRKGGRRAPNSSNSRASSGTCFLVPATHMRSPARACGLGCQHGRFSCRRGTVCPVTGQAPPLLACWVACPLAHLLIHSSASSNAGRELRSRHSGQRHWQAMWWKIRQWWPPPDESLLRVAFCYRRHAPLVTLRAARASRLGDKKAG